MAIIGMIIYGLGIVGSLVCWIMVLIKMFTTEKGPLMGILGILCSLWAYIWGWINAGKTGLKQIMLLWTVAIVLCMIGAAMTAGSMATNLPNQMEMTPRIPSR
ncbi:MAG: hypothetical protein K9N23_18555 [Akkermansiaceae bacterium]|nr:hypothetical protein [Akkermansiaceae bacterium]MCF7733696.1 hypothetical protein [Akkermansiaceae bacterium]